MHTLRLSTLGCQDGSANRGTDQQAWWSKLDSQDGRKRTWDLFSNHLVPMHLLTPTNTQNKWLKCSLKIKSRVTSLNHFSVQAAQFNCLSSLNYFCLLALRASVASILHHISPSSGWPRYRAKLTPRFSLLGFKPEFNFVGILFIFVTFWLPPKRIFGGWTL